MPKKPTDLYVETVVGTANAASKTKHVAVGSDRLIEECPPEEKDQDKVV